MPDDTERLVFMLEARIRDFEKNMAKAEGTATRSYTGMQRGSRSATRQMEADMVRSTGRINQALARTSTQIGAFGKSFAAGAVAPVAGLLTLTAALNGTKAALTKFDGIAKQAKAAGLDGEFFQELGYQAKLGGVEIDQLAAGLNVFAKNAGLAAIGKGELVEKLKLLNPELLTNIQRSTDQEQRIRMVADALAKETDASRKAALAAAVFGDAGVRMVEVFKGGAAAIDETARKAQELGIVVSRDVLARAEELNDEFSTTTEIIDTRLKQALVNLAPILVELSGTVANWTRDLAIVLDQLKQIEDRTFINPLQNKLVEIQNLRAPIVADLQQLRGQLAEMDPASGMAGVIAAEIEQKAARAEELMQQALVYQERIAQLQGKPKGTPTATSTPTAPATGGQTWGADLDLALSPVATGKLDAVASGFSRVSKAAEESTFAIAASTDAVDQLREQWQQAEDLAQSFTSGLISDLMSGKDAVESVADAFDSLGEQLIQMAANQMISSLFGSLFGAPSLGIGPNRYAGGGGFFMGLPSFAGGGGTGTGSRSGGVDGMGGFPAIVHPNETIIDHSAGGSMGGISIVNHMTFAAGTTANDAGSIAREVTRQLRINGPAMIEAYNRNPSRRYAA